MSLQIQGPEIFEQFTVPTPGGLSIPQEYTTQKELRKNKFIWGMLVEVLFHVQATTGVATPLTFLPEFPLSIIDRWRIEGDRIGYGTREFLNVPGDTFQQFVNMFKSTPGKCLVSFQGGQNLQVVGLGLGAGPAGGATLIGSPVSGTNATGPVIDTIASGGTNDFDVAIYYLIPFAPLGIPIEQQAIFMVKGSEWSTLNFHFTFGDQSSLFDNKAGSTFLFGAYGSGTGAVAGNPLFNIHLLRPNLGLQRNKVNPALVWRTFQNLNTTLQSTDLVDGLIARLSVTPDKYVRFLSKTGLTTTDSLTPGVVSPMEGLSDTIITKPELKVSGKLVRNPQSTAAAKEWTSQAHNVFQPTGYFLQDMCELGNANTYFSVLGLTKDDFTYEGNVTSASNQIGQVLEERIEGEAASS